MPTWRKTESYLNLPGRTVSSPGYALLLVPSASLNKTRVQPQLTPIISNCEKYCIRLRVVLLKSLSLASTDPSDVDMLLCRQDCKDMCEKYTCKKCVCCCYCRGEYTCQSSTF